MPDAQHNQDAGQRRTIVPPRPPALRLRKLLGRNQRFNNAPQAVECEACDPVLTAVNRFRKALLGNNVVAAIASYEMPSEASEMRRVQR